MLGNLVEEVLANTRSSGRDLVELLLYSVSMHSSEIDSQNGKVDLPIPCSLINRKTTWRQILLVLAWT